MFSSRGSTTHPDPNLRDKAQRKINELGLKYRENPPEDIDAVWDYLNDNSNESNEARWAIQYVYMSNHRDDQGYDHGDFEDAGRNKIDYEELEWFMEREDIVTQEAIDEAQNDADRVYARTMDDIDLQRGSSMDRNDPMYDPDDRIFLVDVDEDDDSNEYTIEVNGKDAACSDALAALHACRGGLMNLIQSEELSPKNAYVNEIRTRLFMIEGYLNGIRGCTHIVDDQQVM